MRQRCLTSSPNLNLRLVNLPSYSPDLNADEAIWGWARQEVTANQRLGTRAAVREKVGAFSPIWCIVGRKSNIVAVPNSLRQDTRPCQRVLRLLADCPAFRMVSRCDESNRRRSNVSAISQATPNVSRWTGKQTSPRREPSRSPTGI